MKFQIDGEQPEELVKATLEHRHGELDLCFGGYVFLRVLKDGRIHVCTFFKGSPMYIYAQRHGFPIVADSRSGSTQWQLAVQLVVR